MKMVNFYTWGHLVIILFLFVWQIASSTVYAEEQKPPASPTAPPLTHVTTGTAVDPTKQAPVREAELKLIRERYWNKNKDIVTKVMQDKVYLKKHKFEFTLISGQLYGDPFLSTYTLGGSLGYYFSERISTHVFAWKAFVSSSTALDILQTASNTTTNTNFQKYFIGAETRASILYGKLSLTGHTILYLDMYVLGGLGEIGTEFGNNFAIFTGIGQQVNVSQYFSINLDYRLLYYKDTRLAKVDGPTATAGTNLGSFTHYDGMVTLGVSVLFNVFSY